MGVPMEKLAGKSVRPCLTCADHANGRPYAVNFKGGVKTIRLRCPDCLREWAELERDEEGWFENSDQHLRSLPRAAYRLPR